MPFSCVGVIENFSGDPGTFLDSAIAEISGDFPPFNVPVVGTILSAVAST